MSVYIVHWSTGGTFTVEADTYEEAREMANDEAPIEAALNGSWGVQIDAVVQS